MLGIWFFFFFNDTATTEIYTLSLHDALPISPRRRRSASASCRYRRRLDRAACSFPASPRSAIAAPAPRPASSSPSRPGRQFARLVGRSVPPSTPDERPYAFIPGAHPSGRLTRIDLDGAQESLSSRGGVDSPSREI